MPDGDLPELDTSEFLDEEGIQQYQSLVGSLQWAISIGRWDIQTAVMTISSFCAPPRKGDLLKDAREYTGMSLNLSTSTYKFRIEEPHFSKFDNKIKFDWSKHLYTGMHQKMCLKMHQNQ